MKKRFFGMKDFTMELIKQKESQLILPILSLTIRKKVGRQKKTLKKNLIQNCPQPMKQKKRKKVLVKQKKKRLKKAPIK